ncbi:MULTISPECIES: nuclear transport factor 2 family protein [unclassified Nocardia]|uniref:nuclear transport factor 2 family protein n=1 Tax=unclassified Nocardia TaxID=2637762 RepID=UPI0024A7C054|nr:MULTISPECIES: nuclear transport factor 2 family protein [unclassified Nocardia]
MTAPHPKTVVQQAWQAFATHDYDTIAACFTEDAQWLAPSGNATATFFNGPSHIIGRAAISNFLAHDFPKLFAENVSIDFRGFYAEGDHVIVEETMSATLSNGNAYRLDYCFVFELKDGQIHRVREYMDTAAGHRMVFGEQPA